MNSTVTDLSGVLSLMGEYAGNTRLQQDLPSVLQRQFHNCSDLSLERVVVFLTNLAHHAIYPNELVALIEEINLYLEYGYGNEDYV